MNKTQNSFSRGVVIAPRFAEFAVRLSAGYAAHVDMLIIVDKTNYAQEMEDDFRSSRPIRLLKYDFGSRVKKYIALPWLIFRIAVHRPDFIHVQESPQLIVRFLMFVFHPFCKIILTVHDPVPHVGRDAVRVAVRTLRLQESIRRAADMIIVHGEYCREQFLKAYSQTKQRIIVSTHGELFVPTAGEMQTSTANRILFFGRMEAYKGLEVLLKAAKLLVERKENFSLHVAGRGPELKRLRKEFETLPNVIIDQNFLTARKIIGAFQSAAIVVVPYLEATQSGVVAAAFANGRPVVASRVGGLPEIVADGVNGLLVEPNDTVALADAIEKLLKSPELTKRLSEGAVKTASEKLDWDRIAKELLSQFSAYMLIVCA